MKLKLLKIWKCACGNTNIAIAKRCRCCKNFYETRKIENYYVQKYVLKKDILDLIGAREVDLVGIDLDAMSINNLTKFRKILEV